MSETFLLFAGEEYYPTQDDLISIHTTLDSAQEQANSILGTRMGEDRGYTIEVDWWTIYSSLTGKVASSWEDDDE